MNWGLLLKILPFIKDFIPKSNVPLIALGGFAAWLLIGYVDAKHAEVKSLLFNQKDEVYTEIRNQSQLTNIQLAQISESLREVKIAIEKNNDRLFESIKKINTNEEILK